MILENMFKIKNKSNLFTRNRLLFLLHTFVKYARELAWGA